MQIHDIGKQAFYKEDFLGVDGTAQQFMDAISYTVDLSGLQRFKKTCSYHQKMEYCPIIVEIIEERLKEHYGGNYLLQIWDKKGQKYYEKVLIYDILHWNIFYDYLVYKLDDREVGSDWFYLIKLGLPKPFTIKVKDFVNSYAFNNLGVNQDLLYVANERTMKIVDIRVEVMAGGEIEIIPTEAMIATYVIQNTACKLLGFFENSFSRNDVYIMCAVMTEDNQIDFSRLYFWDRTIDNPVLEFYQYREVVQRPLRNDPIAKFRQIIHDDEFQFGIALRQSGQIDLYWNFVLTNAPDSKYFIDVEVNYDNIYLIEKGGQKWQIPTKWDARIGLDVAEKFDGESEWSKIFYSMICNQAKIFSSMCLFSTQFFISHGKIVSMFDVINSRWMDHFYFDDDVYEICRNEKGIEENNLGVYLSNGNMRSIDMITEHSWGVTDLSFQAKGQVITLVSDWRLINTHYILTHDNGKANLYGFSSEILVDLNNQVTGLNMDSNLGRFFSPDANAHFMLFNKATGLLQIWENIDGQGGFSLDVQHEYLITNSDTIEGTISTVVKTENKDFLILIDEMNYYKLNIHTLTIEKYKDQGVTNICVLDVNNFYLMCNKSKKKAHSGFYYQDINTFVDKKKESYFYLEGAIVGANGLLDYNEDNHRIAYMIDYTKVDIVPVLHRNTISFFGMQARDKYLCYRKLNDKLIALDRQNRLTTWSVVNGKFLSQHMLIGTYDFSDYEVWQCEADDHTYLREWYQPICLLRAMTPLEDYTDDDHFQSDMLTTSLANNTAYVRIQNKTFNDFQLIEILNETEIKIHFSFIHPIFPDEQYQRIYFSQDRELMLERLLNNRVFLYQKEPQGTNGQVKWKIIRRLSQFPKDLSEKCYANYLFSPDLKYYLDFDSNSNIFMIIESQTQEVKYIVPRGLMNPEQEDTNMIARMFKWVDSSHIKVINKEGMEKLVNIHNGFKEVAYGQVPMLDLNSYKKKEQVLQFYFAQSDISIQDTYERLKRNYQNYKTTFYLDKVRTSAELYNLLFTVDFQLDRCRGKCVADLTFTFLHWRMCEEMRDSKQYDPKILGSKELKLLSVNLFPQFNTILHFTYKKLNIVRSLYRLAEKEKKTGINCEIPFIKNMKSESPLHLCMTNKNYKAADILLENLKHEGMDNHGRAIYDILPVCIENNLPCVGEYMDSRFRQSEQIKEIKRGLLRYKANMDYSVNYSELWPDLDEVCEKIFVPSKIDYEVKVEFLDIPNFHCYQEKSGDKFFEALANSEQLALFNTRSIQALVDYKWPLAKEYTIKVLFIPFIVFQTLFVLYQNVLFANIDESDEYRQAATAFEVLLIIMSTYFLINEMRQLWINKLSYFVSVWNYTDFIPPILIYVIIALRKQYYEEGLPALATIRALASLLMWAKFLYFLRIFDSTGYLVRMLTTVIHDIRIFFIILTFIYFGFSEAFLRISEMSDPEGQYVLNYADSLQYTFTLSVGNFQSNTFQQTKQPVTAWILMILCALITSIVMFNLIVSILGESFEDINVNSKLANYQERACIIAENSYLIPKYKKRVFCPINKYLIVAKDLAEEINTVDPAEEVHNKVQELQALLDKMKSELNAGKNQVFEDLDLAITNTK